MQERHSNRALYFKELATTSKKYFVPYIEQYKKIEAGMSVLEIGCGDGGNLLPFSEMGCDTIGVDLAEARIKDAIVFFQEANAKGRFIASDVFKIKEFENTFDLIICHDVIEHIDDKKTFLSNLKKYIKKDGIIFMSFPAWQMPFGGHQQIAVNKVISHAPFLHLLPAIAYKTVLRWGNEDEGGIKELLSIKRTKMPIEKFEKLVKEENFQIINRELFLINPHYEIKFGLKTRKLPSAIGGIPYVRNFFVTSSFYILKA